MGGLLAGLGSLVSSGVNYFSQRDTNEANERMTRETNAMNSSIAQENRDWQESMWREQTAYNSPQAQMTRLQAAGLNPNLVYGQIAESKMANAPSPTVPHMEAAHFDAPKLEGNPVADYQQVKNQQALNALTNINIEKAKSEAISAAVDADYKQYENNKLQNAGVVKGDSALFRNVGRAWETFKSGVQGLGRGAGKLDLYSGDAPSYGYLKGR